MQGKMNTESAQNQSPDAEIDFMNLAITFWDGRFVISKIIIISLFIGIFVS